MKVGTRKLDLGSPAARTAPPMPAHAALRERTESDRLRVVRFDEPEFLNGEILDQAAKFARSPHHLPGEGLGSKDNFPQADAEQKVAFEEIPAHEPGVDLTSIQPQDADVARLATFTQKVASLKKNDKSADSHTSSKPVVMPHAQTDLVEILQADKVCMVNRPKHNAPTLDVEEESPHSPPPATCSILAQQKTPHLLDRTQQYLVDNWEILPPNVQAAILNVIDAAISPDDE
jgi:hypothetical protein